METRTFTLSSYDISPSDNLADYYNKTVSSQYGTVTDNRMSMTWNNVNLQQIVGNDFYNTYNQFSIKLVNYTQTGAPTSDSGTTSSVQQLYQDAFVNVYLKGLPFYPPAPNGALMNVVNIGLVSTTTGGTAGQTNSSSLSWTFLKTSTANLGIHIRSVGTEQPYSPGDIMTNMWGHSVCTFEVTGLTDVSNVSYVDLSNNSVLHNGAHTIYTDLTPNDQNNYIMSSSISSITVTPDESSIAFSPSIPSYVVYETDLSNVLVTTIGEQNGEIPAGTTRYYLNSSFTNEVTKTSILDYGSYTIYALFTPSTGDYSASSTSTSLIVTQKSTSIVYTTPSSIVYGTTIASSLTATCTVAGTIAYFYDASFSQAVQTTDVKDFGTYTIYARFTPATNNYLPSSTSVSLSVTKAPTTLTYNALSAITYGTTIGASLNATPSIAGTTNYYLDSAYSQLLSSTNVLNASTYTIYAVFTPSSSNYSSSNASRSITVNKQPTTIAFPNISSFIYETTMSAFISGTTAGGVAGTFAFSQNGNTLTSASVLNVGTYTISATFTPSDLSNYLTSSNTKSLTVTTHSTSVAFSGSIPSSVVYNTGLTSVLSVVVTPNVAGSTSYHYVNASSQNVSVTTTSVIPVGSYTIHATFTPSTGDYAGSSTTTALTVTQATPTVTYSGLSGIVYQTTLAASLNATISPSIDGSFNYYIGSTEVFPTTVLNVGSYTINAVFTSRNANYTNASKQTGITVSKFTPTLDYNVFAPIVYGTTIASSLTATSNVAGTFAYSTNGVALSSTDVLNAGMYIIIASFTPTDTSNYNSGSTTSPVTVNKQPTSITFPATSSIVYETTMSSFISGTTVSNGVAGTFAFSTNGTTITSSSVLHIGTYTISCTFTPSNTSNYLSSTNTKSLSVTTHSTTLAFASSIPSSIVYGNTLAQVSVMVITPDVSGTLRFYTDSVYLTEVQTTTVLDAGAYTIYSTFTPTSSDYTSSSTSTNLTVTKATTAVTYPTLSNIVYGTTMSSSFSAFVTPSILGAFSYYYMNGATKVSLSTADLLNVGSYTIYVDFTPSSSNYTGSSNNRSLTVTAAPTTVIYDTPSNIIYTATLASSLTATAYPNIAGSMKYYINAAEVTSATTLNAGTYSISATFTPTSSNYTASTTTRSLTVNKKSTTITFPNISTIVYETTLSTLVAGTTTGIAGTFSFFENDLNGNALTSSSVLESGSYTIFCRFVPTDSANYLSSQSTTSLIVTVKSTTLAFSGSIPSSIVYETTLATVLQTTPTPNVAGTTVYKISGTDVSAGTIMDVGTYTVEATFTPTADDYAQSSTSTTISVTQRSTTLLFTIPSSIVYGTTLNSSLTATCTKAGTISYFYDSSHTLVASGNDALNAGTYTIYALFTPTSSNYLSSVASSSLIVTKQSTTVTFESNVPTVLTYETTVANVLHTQVSPTIAGTATYYYYSASTRIDLSSNDVLVVGSYTVHADFVPTDSANYSSSTVTMTLLVSQKPITVIYSGLSAITYGETLATSLTASLGQTVDGSMNYYTDSLYNVQVTSATTLNAGSYTIYARFTPSSGNYVAYPVSTSLVVNKFVPTVIYTIPSSPIIYGTQLQSSFTASVSPAVSGSFKYYYLNDELSSTQILNVGSYSIRAAFTSSDPNYANADTTSTLQVSQQTPTITFGVSSFAYETTFQTFISGTTASTAGTFAFYKANGDALLASDVLVVDIYTIHCTFTPTDSTNYTIKTASSGLTVQKQTPTITFSSLSGLTYGTTLAAFISGTTASVPGTFSFDTSGQSVTSTTVLTAATYAIRCVFVANDLANYVSSTSSTKTGFVVSKQTTTITLSQQSSITYGTTFASFINGTTASIPGTLQFYITDASGQQITSSSVLDVATYTIYTKFTPTDGINYLGSNATKSFTVVKQTPTITLSAQTGYSYGTTFASFITQTTASTGGSFNFFLNDELGQVLTSSTVLTVASYTIYCKFTPSNLSNYNLAYATRLSFAVSKQFTTITMSSINTLVYGTTINDFINQTTASVAGTFQFKRTDVNGEVLTNSTQLTVGTHVMFCAFTPSDTANYSASTAIKSLVISKQDTTISLPSISGITYGTTLSSFISGTTASVAGTFVFRLNSSSGQIVTSTTVLTAATYTIFCAFTPTDSTNYNTSIATKTSFVVSKQAASITMASLSGITYGTTMSSFISGTTASVDGSFNFFLTSASGQALTSSSVLTAGTYTIFCAFTPSTANSTNYSSTTATKTSFVVSKQTTTITPASLSTITYGTTLATFIAGTTASVAGTFQFSSSGQILTSSTILSAATYDISCSFTPTDATNYLSSTATKSSFVVSKQGTSITLASLTNITYGTTFAGYVAGTTGSVGGTFTFTDSNGTSITSSSVLTVGSYTITGSLNPTDSTNYSSSTATSTTPFVVSKQTAVISMAPIDTLTYGTTFASFIAGTTATTAGTFQFSLSGEVLTTTSVISVGTHTVQCTFVPTDTTNFTSQSVATKSITVSKQTPTITFSSMSGLTYGTTFATFITETTASTTGTFVFRLNDASGQLLTSSTVLPVATYTIFCAFTSADTSNYNNTVATKSSFAVTKQTTSITLSSSSGFTYGTTLASFISGTTASVAGTLQFYLGSDTGLRLTPSTVLDASTHVIYCTFVPTDTTNYSSSNATKTGFLVSKQSTSITLASLGGITYETTLESFINGTTASEPGTFEFMIDGTAVTRLTKPAAGSYDILCSFTPTDTTNYLSSSATKSSFVVLKKSTTITVSPLSGIVYGTTLASLINGTTGSEAGTIVFKLSGDVVTSTTVLTAATYSIDCEFTPTDTDNYLSSTATKSSFVVSKQTPVITMSTMSNLLYGETFEAYINGTTATVAGTFQFNLTNAAGDLLITSTVLELGSYTIHCAFVPSDTTNYTSSATKTKTLLVSTKTSTSITFPSITTLTYGDTLAAFISGTISSVSGELIFTNISQQVLTSSSLAVPTILCTFVPTDSDTYAPSYAEKTLIIEPQQTSITMASLSGFTYGSTFQSFIEQTTASINSGVFKFQVTNQFGDVLTAASVLSAGTYTIFCTFTPSDTTNYLPSTASKSAFEVSKPGSAITLSSLSGLTYGETLETFINGTTADISGSLRFTISGALVTRSSVLQVATYTIDCSFTPIDTTNYQSASASKTFTVSKQSPTITLSSLSEITYGTTLQQFIEDTVTSTAGTMEYRVNGQLVSSSTILSVASYTIDCTLTPTNSTDYSTLTVSKTGFVVSKQTPTITMSLINSITYGTTMESFISDTTASTAGSFTFRKNNDLGEIITGSTVLSVASYTIHCRFMPNDTTNYTYSTFATKSLQVQKQYAAITMSSTTQFTYGTSFLSFINATTSITPGTFAFYTSGQALTGSSVLTTGSYSIYCEFFPTDTTNYLQSSSATTTIQIQQATTSITLSTINSLTYGETLAAFINATTASTSGTLNFYHTNASGQLLTTSTILDAAESFTIYCEFLPTDFVNYQSSTATKSLTIQKRSASISTSVTSFVYGTPFSTFADATTSTVPGTIQFSLFGEVLTGTSLINASATPYSIECTFVPTDASNNLSSTVTKSLQVSKKETFITLSSISLLTYGTTLATLIGDTTGSVAGTFVYRLTDASGTILTSSSVLNVGTYTIYSAFTPTDSTNYTGSTATKSLEIQKQGTTITLSTITSLFFGTSMAGFINGTTASIVGTLRFYINNTGGQQLFTNSTLNASTYTIFCSFTPTDAINYASSSATQILEVKKSNTTITLSSASQLTYGDNLATFINGTTASVGGTLQFNLTNLNGQVLSTSTVLSVANYTIYCTFTPSNGNNYLPTTTIAYLSVKRRSTIITLSSISDLGNGDTFASFISETTASIVDGSFNFYLNDAAGQSITNTTVLNTGTYTIYSTFTPTDTSNYASSTASKIVTVHVERSVQITVPPITNRLIYGDTLASFINAVTAPIEGTFSFYINNQNGQYLTSSTVLTVATYTIYCIFLPNDSANYLPANKTTTLYVDKHDTTITLSSSTSFIYGSTIAAFIDGCSSSVPGVLQFFVTNTSGQQITRTTILNAATYSVYTRFLPTDSTNYAESNATAQIVMAKRATTISVTSVTSLTYGTNLSSFMSGMSGSVAGSFSFRINDASGQLLSSSTILDVSGYTIYSVFSPTVSGNYLSSNVTLSLEVVKRLAPITLSSINSLTYGTNLTSFINGTSTVATGSFDFYLTNTSGQLVTRSTILPAATYTIFVSFTPTNPNNDLPATASKTLLVNKQSTSITLSSINSIIYETSLAAFISGTTASVGGSLSFRLTDSSGDLLTSSTILQVGSYTIYCGFEPSDGSNYLPSSTTKTFQVDKKETVITLSSIDSIVYLTTMSAFIAGTTASVDGSLNFYLTNDSGEQLNSTTVLNAATYTIFTTFTPSDTTNYLTSSTTKTFVVQKHPTSVTLSSFTTFVYESTIATFMDDCSASVPGSFQFSISGEVITRTTILNARSYTVNALFTPSDSTNYSTSSAITTIQINKQITTITLSSITNLIYEDLFGLFVNTTTASVAGSFNFYINDASGDLLTSTTVLDAGTYSIFAAFTPSDQINYLTSSASRSLAVSQNAATITLSSINSFIYGQTMAAFISGTTVSEDGVLSFYANDVSLNSSTVLAAGVYTILCEFAPSNPEDYSARSATKTLTVEKQPTSIVLPPLSTIIYETTLAAFINGTTSSVAGSFSFRLTDAYGQLLTTSTVLNVGSYTIFCSFVPTDSANYLPISTTRAFQVNKKTTSITLSSINSIVYLTTMAGFINGTTATVNGTLSFYLTDALGQQLTSSTVLTVATYTIYCSFVPSSTSNYLPSTSSKSLQVVRRTPTITFSSINSVAYGDALGSFITGTTASTTGTLSFFLTDASGQSINALTILGAATYTIFASFVPTDLANFTTTTSTKQLTTVQKLLTVVYGALTAITYGTTLEARLNATVSPIVDGSMNYFIGTTPVSLTTVLNAASSAYSIRATFTPVSSNYTTSSATSTLVVNKAPTTVTYPALESVLYNLPIGGACLIATSTPGIAGTMAYFTDSAFTNQIYANTLLAKGSYTLYARFTPTSSNYAVSFASTPLTVLEIMSTTIAFPNVTTIPVYTTLESFINSTTTGVAGTYVFRKNNSSGVILTTSSTFDTLGNFAVYCSFTPTSSLYLPSSAIYITKVKYTPTILFTQRPSSTISYGTNLTGSALSATVSQYNNANIAGTITYSNNTTTNTILLPGLYTVTATFTPTNLDFFNVATTSKQILVNKQQFSITITSPSVKSAFIKSAPIDCSYQVLGILTALGDTFANSVTGTIVNKYMNMDETALLTSDYVYNTTFAGSSQTYKIAADISGFSSSKYEFASQSYTFTVNKYTPTINYTIQTANKTLTYGAKLTSSQLNAIVSYGGNPVSSGSVVYTRSAINLALTVNTQTVLEVGQHYLYAYFSDSSDNLYNNVDTSTVTTNRITIDKATPTISFPNITSILSGSTLADILDYTIAVSNGSVVAGTFAFSYVNGSGSTVALTSSTVLTRPPYAITITATFTPTDATRYNSSTNTKAVQLCDQLSSISTTTLLSSPVTYGKRFNEIYSITGSVAGTFAYYEDATVIDPASIVDVGTRTYTVILNPTSTTFASSLVDLTFTIQKASLSLTYASPPTFVYNSPLSLSPVVSPDVSGVLSIFTDSSFATPLPSLVDVGTYTLYVKFTPTSQNYNVAQTTTTLTITKIQTALLYTTKTSTITYGVTNASLFDNAVVGDISGSLSYFYDASFTTVAYDFHILAYGSHTIYSRFVPTDTAHYTSVSATHSITVTKAVLSIVYAALDTIEYGTSLASSLSATSPFEGTFTYVVNGNQVLSNTRLNAGSYNIVATFVPASLSNFTTSSVTVTRSLTVSKQTPTLTYAPTAIQYGTSLATSLNATVSPNILGTMRYFSNSSLSNEVFASNTLGVGSYTFYVTFVPSDTTNYASASTSAPLRVIGVSPSSLNISPILTNMFTFEASGGFIMQRGFDDIKLRDYTVVERYDVTDSVQVLFDVALFNAKLGINKNAANTQIMSSMFNPVTDQFEINGEPVNNLSFTASEFIEGVTKSQQIISVGKYSNVYSDFKNYVITYFGYDGGFSSLFTAASEFTIDEDNVFDSDSMLQLFTGVTSTGTAYINQMTGSFSLVDIVKTLRYSVNTNCFGNRNPLLTTGGTAADPAYHSNYGVADGFVAGDLIWVNSGTTFKLNLNIDTESFAPLNNSGPEYVSQITNTSTLNFSQTTTASTTNINRTVRAPLLIKLVNASTIDSL